MPSPFELFISNTLLTTPHTVTWGEMDAFKHVNNTHYFRYFENIRIAHFTQAGFMDVMAAKNTGPIVAETRCRFKAPLTFPDTLTIGVSVKDLGTDSFTHVYTVFSEKLNRVAAEGEAKVVYYDYNNHARCNIPDELVKAIN